MADDDDFGMGGIEDQDGYAVASAAGELSVIAGGAKVLKAASAVGCRALDPGHRHELLELVGPHQERQHRRVDHRLMQNSRLLQVLSTTLQSTWGYLLVAVIAYAGAMLLHGQRMRLLVAAMSDDD